VASVRMTPGKYQGITALADERGVIAAAAMDQRGSLRQMIAQARGDGRVTTAEDLTRFKTAVTQVLTRYASGILLDPEYGLPALRVKAPRTGVLLSYEKSGYDPAAKGRLPELLPEWSARRLVEAGANAVKVLLYYNPFDEERINTIKHALIERVGAECAAQDVPFFLELVTYDGAIGDAHGLAFARRKPALVTRTTAEFTRPTYRIDVLKVEIPVNLAFVAGTRTCEGRPAYTRQDALRLIREAVSAATKPFIYLSGGVTADVFQESLELVAEAGAPFAGVLCGRANWQGGVPAYAQRGSDALVAWLEEEGVRNITALNGLLAAGARPWWTVYGGNDHIEIVAADQ
jgi:tagatose 1,6-diphosphate aldolase